MIDPVTGRTRCSIQGCSGSSKERLRFGYLCPKHYRLVPRAWKAERRAVRRTLKRLRRDYREGTGYKTWLAFYRAHQALEGDLTCRWLAMVREAQIGAALGLDRRRAT